MEITNLKSYLAECKMTIRQFCEILGCSSEYMSRVYQGKKTCGKRLARDVFELTEGIVKLPTSDPKDRKKKVKKKNDK